MVFAAKCYVPGMSQAEIAEVTERAERASRLSDDGPVACLGSIAFVDEQLVLWLFEAPSRLVVREVSERASVPCERVMETELRLPIERSTA